VFSFRYSISVISNAKVHKSQEIDFQLAPLTDTCFNRVQRSRYYSIIWVESGSGTVKYEFNEHPFSASSLLFFVPYQPFSFIKSHDLTGTRLHFSPDFYCIERHSSEVSCSGVLFNTIYDRPVVCLNAKQSPGILSILLELQRELALQTPPNAEYLRAYLKILLIQALRVKQLQRELREPLAESAQHHLAQLPSLIETHFRTHKRSSDYATMLNISTATLTKLAKTHFERTVTQLIHQRIIVEAKRELFFTDKMIKQISFELGYSDEFYFSRLFKKLTGTSPEQYRRDYFHV
jgi:AraC-like DNA-binding protein